MNRNYIIAFLLFASSNVLADDISFGAGLGIPYGVAGANMNYQIDDTFDATVGLGIGYGAGIRYHPVSSRKKFRLTAYYGTNVVISKSDTNTLERFNGLNFGIGYGALSDGWDIDLIYVIVSQEAKDRVAVLKSQGYIGDDVDNTISLSFGYHW